MTQLADKILHLLTESSEDPLLIDKKIDQFFGLDYQEIEASIKPEKPKEADYVHSNLEAQALYTSYFDFYHILKNVAPLPGQAFVDLGSGMSRSKLLIDTIFPELKSIAIEKSKERIEAALKAASLHSLPKEGYHHQDLLKSKIPEADYYFLYLPTGEILDHILSQLEDIAKKKQITVIAIESHGDLIPHLKLNALWLSALPLQLPSMSKRHDQNIYFFQSSSPLEHKRWIQEKEQVFQVHSQKLNKDGLLSLEEIPPYWRHSFLQTLKKQEQLQFVVKEDDYSWLGSILNFHPSLTPSHYSLNQPPREVEISKIKMLKRPDSIEREWIKKRSQELIINRKGVIRKIIVEPDLLIELSDGKRYPISKLT